MDQTKPRPRVHTADTRPFAVPRTLSELQGPAAGLLELPHHVYWGPDPVVDLDTDAGLGKAYEATLREGLLDDLRGLVNAERLCAVWHDLVLPLRIRAAWERALGPALG